MTDAQRDGEVDEETIEDLGAPASAQDDVAGGERTGPAAPVTTAPVVLSCLLLRRARRPLPIASMSPPAASWSRRAEAASR